MAGTIKTNAVQLGDSATATQNFTLRTNADGTATLARGNVGATTQDILTIPSSGAASIVGARQLLQSVTYQTGAVVTGTALIPSDDTIPQITEGDQYLSLAITPINASSMLEIDVAAVLTTSTGQYVTLALFKNPTADAVSVAWVDTTTGGAATVPLSHSMVAGTTSAITFSVRIGGNVAGTTTFNGLSGARRYGGVLASRITIKEYAA